MVEQIERDRKWTAKFIARQRAAEAHAEHRLGQRRPISQLSRKKPAYMLDKVPHLDGGIAAKINHFTPKTDGSVAPKPQPGMRLPKSGVIMAQAMALNPMMMWPQDMSYKEPKLKRVSTAPASLRDQEPENWEACSAADCKSLRSGDDAASTATPSYTEMLEEDDFVEPVPVNRRTLTLSKTSCLRRGPAMIANPNPLSGGVKMMWPQDIRWRSL
eukprot:TRINITY_DN115311_c0_g1_i1.p1 TRINITY_DN115311_c0_g1~~TRINITY_DN115311_c0_g1_i1.p1  ORF type:complete len:237 (-),score=37.47 TRINITY_DN115311_c0_g1_i1:98-742(-)